MSEIFASVLIIGGPILAVVFAIGVLALIGLVSYDVISSRESAPALSKAQAAALSNTREHEGAVARMYIERGVARAFVILGASFWGISAVASMLFYQRGAETMLYFALIPFLMNIACLIIGWRWERTASLMLVLTGASAIWWGLVSGFEVGVWALFVLLWIGPMFSAAVLFWLARQGEIDLALGLALRPELIPVRATR